MRLMFWAIFAAMTGVYLAMVFWSLPAITAGAGGLLPFDLRATGYSFDQARAFLAATSDETRAFYLNVQQGLDMAFPALMAVTLVMAFRFLFRGAVRLVLSSLAVLAAGLDYLENAAVAVMLRAGADGLNEAMVAAASRWTVLKSAIVTLVLIALLAGLAMAFLRRRRKGAG